MQQSISVSDSSANSSIYKACNIKDWSRVESVIATIYDDNDRYIQDVLLYKSDNLNGRDHLPTEKKDHVVGGEFRTSITVNYIC